MNPVQRNGWDALIRAIWVALGEPWRDVCRLVTGNATTPSVHFNEDVHHMSYAWWDRSRHGGRAGIYLEPTRFELPAHGNATRDGVAIDIAVRLHTESPAAEAAREFFELAERIDRGLHVGLAVYPNPEADQHPVGQVVVCEPPAGVAYRFHNWDPNGLWISLRYEMDGLDDFGDERVADVTRALTEKLRAFRQTVRLALAFLAEPSTTKIPFEKLLGWCGEYVVATMHGAAFRWDGGYSPCDFTADTGDIRAIEVKTTTRDSLRNPRFSLDEVRHALGLGDAYRVARVLIDHEVVEALQAALRTRESAAWTPNLPPWSMKLAAITGRFIAPDAELEGLLDAVMRTSRIDWYTSPFAGDSRAHLDAVLRGTAMVFGSGNVEVPLPAQHRTDPPALK